MANHPKDFWIGPSFSDIHYDWEIPFLGMEKLPFIIGLSGPTKSGKSIMAKQLATRYGFQYISLTEYLDDIAKSRGIVGGHWRDLGNIAIKLREEQGDNLLAKIALKKIITKYRSSNKFVIDSIFHPAEVRFLRKRMNFLLIWVQVDFELRVTDCFL